VAKPITPEVVYELTSVGDPALSPSGDTLVFTESTVDRETMTNRSVLVSMDLANGTRTLLTDGPKDSVALFSPEGRTLAFSREDDEKQPQIWLIRLGGGGDDAGIPLPDSEVPGGLNEPTQLTSVVGGARQVAWSPDGSTLAFMSVVDPDRLPPDHDPNLDPRVRVVTRLKYRHDTIGWLGDSHTHIFSVSASGGEPTQWIDGDWDDRAPTWSPDSRSVAYVSHHRDDRDLVPFNEAYAVPAGGGESVLWSDRLTEVVAMAWSAAGDQLAVIGSGDERIGASWQGGVFILTQGEPPQRISADGVKPNGGFPPIAPAPEMRWTDDGRLLFIGDHRGESFVFEIDVASGETRKMDAGGWELQAITFNRDASIAVLGAKSPNSAGDLYKISLVDGEVSRLTSVNADYFAEHPLASLEKFTISRGDLDIECRLLFPPDFDQALSYPLIVDIHGGPHGAFYDTFNATQQVLATHGYLVLLVNPRGSSTYGSDFAKAVIGDWGGEDYLDIMAAVDEVSSRPYVDVSRLGVHGYSYGGYMTSWIVGHDHRFQAAVVGAPVINFDSMYGTSDIGVSFGEIQWGGKRNEAAERFRERSPLTYAEHVDTPVLLMHGEADNRCPIEQSEQFFVALKRLGKQVEFVRFPDCSHLFMRAGHPRMREEYLTRLLAWFDRFVGRETR
jgi:dipeptidyl aminopeptidase/acylaminoacyl peptidase